MTHALNRTTRATRVNLIARIFTITLAVITVVLSPLTAPLAHAEPPCSQTWPPPIDPDPDCPPYVAPVYYTWLYQEPDWCTYSEGDEVYILFDAYNNFTPYAWYVTPAADPGRDGDWFVLNNPTNGCGLFQYPW